MNKNILTIAVLLFFTACKPQSKGIANISVTDLKNQLKNGIQLVDVRTPGEWREGIIEGAVKIDVTSNSFEKQAINKLDKSKPVYLYCRTGGRSLVAAKILLEKGYKVYNVEGGYKDWKRQN